VRDLTEKLVRYKREKQAALTVHECEVSRVGSVAGSSKRNCGSVKRGDRILTQLQCLEATVDREKKIDVAAGYILLYEASRKGSLVSEAIKALSFSRVRGHLGNASGARIWLSGCNADALVPQVDEGDNAGEFSTGKTPCVPRLPQSRAISNTELVGDDSALDVICALPLYLNWEKVMYDVRDESLLKALNGRSLHEREIMASVQNGAMEAFLLEGSIVAAVIRASIAAERSALKRRTLDAMNRETLSRAALRGTREEQSLEFAHIFQSRAFAKVGEVPDSVDSIVDIPLDVMTLALWRRSPRFF
jgi:hypothetical protein